MVSSRFWMYWAVALPLTIMVLVIWLLWIRTHKSTEDTPFEQSIAALSKRRQAIQSTLQAPPTIAGFAPPRRTPDPSLGDLFRKSWLLLRWPEYPLLGKKKKVKTEEEGDFPTVLDSRKMPISGDVVVTSRELAEKPVEVRRRKFARGARR